MAGKGRDTKDPECIVDPFEQLKITLNPDGSLTREEYLSAPATGEDELVPGQPYVSKDVTLNADNETWMRIFRPKEIHPIEMDIDKLPIILYFHAGGFVLYHASTMFFNETCGRYSSEVPSIVISVEFRAAPENRLPAAYDDAKEAVFWIKKQALDPQGDVWLRNFADFSRFYLMGCSSGATIAYRTALAAPELDLGPVKMAGLIINQPFFGGLEKTRLERRKPNDVMIPRSSMDLLWELALPVGSDQDHEYCNPFIKGSYHKNIGLLPRTLIRAFQGDPLMDRDIHFVKMLMKLGVQITGHFGEIGFHCADSFDATRNLTMIKYMKDFI